MSQIFDVDKRGLAKLLERRGIAYILYELYQNAADAEGVSEIRMALVNCGAYPMRCIVCEDDAPDGFKKLSDAWTLFAESEKKGNAELRGRYNLGEKLVIALCRKATIATTTGTVVFDDDGRRTRRDKTKAGSTFTGEFKATNVQVEEIEQAVQRLIIPEGVKVTFNGDEIKFRNRVAYFEESLQTEIADNDGVIQRVTRKARVDIHEPREGETGWVYELGIPVVETGDKYHYDVQQKVPLTFERDNVPPAFLRTLRTFALNATFDQISTEEANASWARDAAADKRATVEAIKTVADKRFGEKRVSYDPSDPEANHRAVAAGYVVVHGSMGSGQEWDNLRRAQAILPAGQVTPSDKPYSAGGKMETVIPQSDWTEEMRRTAAYAKFLARELMDVNLEVKITKAGTNFMMCYSREVHRLAMNLSGGCTASFFKNVGSIDQDDILIHEFGHEYESNHLSKEYYRALTVLGAKLKVLALNKPALLRKMMGEPR